MGRYDAGGEMMASRVRRYLIDSRVAFQLIPAPPNSSAPSGGLGLDHLARAVLLRDEDHGDFVLAVFPASRDVVPGMVTDLLGRRTTLASACDAQKLFPDCDVTALPPIGQRYGVETVVDASLEGLQEVCFPCGNCQCLAQVSGSDFARMMGAARRGPISASASGARPVTPTLPIGEQDGPRPPLP